MDYRARTAYQGPDTAADYDRRRSHSWRRRLLNRLEKAILLRLARQAAPRGSLVLDIPCGTGRFSEFLLEAGYVVVGADISMPMLHQAAAKFRRHPGLQGLVIADAESLPFRDGAAPLVTCVRLMGHLPPESRASVLAELARVSGGEVLLTHATSVSLDHLVRLAGRALASLWRGSLSPVHYFPATPLRILGEMRRAGLAIKSFWLALPFVSEHCMLRASAVRQAERE